MTTECNACSRLFFGDSRQNVNEVYRLANSTVSIVFDHHAGQVTECSNL